MPKKRQDKALLIKPGSQASKAPPSSRQNDSSSPSVNDLIRESRRLQLKNEPPPSTPLTASVPPHLRTVLNLPAPQSPPPRSGARVSGPLRLRRIPGPPPPHSWLVDSRHAPISDLDIDYHGRRLQTRTSALPGSSFTLEGSLQHMTLKELAVNWEWHAEFDGRYLAILPTALRESLLSYIAVYNDDVETNPLRLLFLTEDDADSRAEVSRLDLSAAVGNWTSLKQLMLDLSHRDNTPSIPDPDGSKRTGSVPTSWDEDEEQRDSIDRGLKPAGMAFQNLKHLSLALIPGKLASWKDLIRLTGEVSTITSLSLASWPQPTYTPRAAATRAILKPASNLPGTLYGGSNFYTALDNDWREAAGILRTLSRTLYCLRWLDLTGCGDWFDALIWQPADGTSGPEWNGSWRGIEHMCLSVGWKPVEPEIVRERLASDDGSDWDVQAERQNYYHRKEMARHAEISRAGEAVVQYLRSLRRAHGGKWIKFDHESTS